MVDESEYSLKVREPMTMEVIVKVNELMEAVMIELRKAQWMVVEEGLFGGRNGVWMVKERWLDDAVEGQVRSGTWPPS